MYNNLYFMYHFLYCICLRGVTMSRQSNPTKNISHQLYEILKYRIIKLEYEPSTYLKEENIAKEFNISRTPIREAMRELRNDLLLEFNKGNLVTPVSLDTYAKIFTMREHLELLSVKLATLNWADSDIALLEENIGKQKQLIFQKEYNPKIFTDLDREFHWLLVKTSKNNFLEKDLMKYYNLFARYNYLCGFEKRKDYAVSEHEIILNMLKARDIILAEAKMKDHLKNINGNILLLIANKI